MYFCAEEGAPCTTFQISTWEIKIYHLHGCLPAKINMSLACYGATDNVVQVLSYCPGKVLVRMKILVASSYL